jgi:hypothetical protein
VGGAATKSSLIIRKFQGKEDEDEEWGNTQGEEEEVETRQIICHQVVVSL